MNTIVDLMAQLALSELDNSTSNMLSGDEDQTEAIILPNEINGNWISRETSIHEARLKAKAKRRLRKNSSRDSGRGDSLSDNGESSRNVIPNSPKGKMLDRKSRMGKGRGLPKKGKYLRIYFGTD